MNWISCVSGIEPLWIVNCLKYRVYEYPILLHGLLLDFYTLLDCNTYWSVTRIRLLRLSDCYTHCYTHCYSCFIINVLMKWEVTGKRKLFKKRTLLYICNRLYLDVLCCFQLPSCYDSVCFVLIFVLLLFYLFVFCCVVFTCLLLPVCLVYLFWCLV